MTAPLLLRPELDAARCQHPGCTDCGPLFIHPDCHVESSLLVSYYQGEIEITCAECEGFICRIAVAG